MTPIPRDRALVVRSTPFHARCASFVAFHMRQEMRFLAWERGTYGHPADNEAQMRARRKRWLRLQ